MTTKIIVRFTQVSRGKPRITRAVWVKSVSWKEGAGNRVNRVVFTPDYREAAHFSLATAIDIAVQYYSSPASLEHADGTPMPEETRKLRDEQRQRFAEAVETRQRIREEFNQFLREAAQAVPSLAELLRSR